MKLSRGLQALLVGILGSNMLLYAGITALAGANPGSGLLIVAGVDLVLAVFILAFLTPTDQEQKYPETAVAWAKTLTAFGFNLLVLGIAAKVDMPTWLPLVLLGIFNIVLGLGILNPEPQDNQSPQ